MLSWAHTSVNWAYFSFINPLKVQACSPGHTPHGQHASSLHLSDVSEKGEINLYGGAPAHGAMGHRIHPSWWTRSVISHSSQCSTTAVTKALAGMRNISMAPPWGIDLMTHCTICNWEREKERNVLFNDALNTFYLRLYGVRHMVKDHSDSEKGNPLPPHID